MWRGALSGFAALWLLAGSPASSAETRTWADVRSGCVVRQQLDFSCGLAALATILKFEFGLKTGEQDLLQEILALAQIKPSPNDRPILDKANTACGSRVSFSHGSARKELLENGASLLQLWCLAQMHGVQAFVREATPEFLVENLDRPIIVHLTIDDALQHFAVLRKIDGRWVHLADPSRGCKVYLLSSFLREWRKRQVLILHRSNGYTPLQGRLSPKTSAETIEHLRTLASP